MSFLDLLAMTTANTNLLVRRSGNHLTELSVPVAAFLLAVVLGFLTVAADILVVAFLGLAGSLAIILLGWRFAVRTANSDRRVAIDLFLLWTLVINLPVFVAFDQTGLTRIDMFNPQSIGRIILFVTIGTIHVMSRFTRRRHPSESAATLSLTLYPALPLLWYLALCPVLAARPVDMLLMAYRALEWALLMSIVVALIHDLESTERGSFANSPLRFALPIVVFLVVITFVVFPLLPRTIYQVGQAGIGRIGNSFAHPNVLGIIAGMGVFYALEIGTRYRWLFVAACAALLVGSYSRAAWAGFACALVLYLTLRCRQGIPRLLAGISLSLFLALAYIGQDILVESVAAIATRGRNHEDLASASERTSVWRAASVLIAESPWIGHGYVVGPKKLNDVMATGTSAAYFRANHAHNEFVQALLNGGLPAAALTIMVWLRCVLLLYRLAQCESNRAFVRCSSAWLVMLLAYGVMTPMLSMHLMIPGALLLFVYLSAEYKWRAAIRWPRQKVMPWQPGPPSGGRPA